MCNNFLDEEIPDYDQKMTAMPSRKYDNIWCITNELPKLGTKTVFDLAFTLLHSVIDKSKA